MNGLSDTKCRPRYSVARISTAFFFFAVDGSHADTEMGRLRGSRWRLGKTPNMGSACAGTQYLMGREVESGGQGTEVEVPRCCWGFPVHRLVVTPLPEPVPLLLCLGPPSPLHGRQQKPPGSPPRRRRPHHLRRHRDPVQRRSVRFLSSRLVSSLTVALTDRMLCAVLRPA